MFEVVDGGPMTTVQDLGRPGYASMGIPPSGAFDAFSLKAGNLLVRNDLGEAGLEVLMAGLRLKACAEMAIAITGGDLAPTLNGQPVEMWKVVQVLKGDILHFTKLRSGCRAYLTVAGGIDVQKVLGSKSTFLRGAMGGYEGRSLRGGDRIGVGESLFAPQQLNGRRAASQLIRDFGRTFHVRAMRGLEDFLFEDQSIDVFFSSEWKVTPLADRMGIRYEGPVLKFKTRDKIMDYEGGADPSNILNECIPTGAIQVVSGRVPIVLAVDGPSTGGYVKIATVISPDLSWIAQSKHGDSTFFRSVGLEEALQALREEDKLLREEFILT